MWQMIKPLFIFVFRLMLLPVGCVRCYRHFIASLSVLLADGIAKMSLVFCNHQCWDIIWQMLFYINIIIINIKKHYIAFGQKQNYRLTFSDTPSRCIKLWSLTFLQTWISHVGNWQKLVHKVKNCSVLEKITF